MQPMFTRKRQCNLMGMPSQQGCSKAEVLLSITANSRRPWLTGSGPHASAAGSRCCALARHCCVVRGIMQLTKRDKTKHGTETVCKPAAAKDRWRPYLLQHGCGFRDGNCTGCLVVGKQPNTPQPDPDGPCFGQEQIWIGALGHRSTLAIPTAPYCKRLRLWTLLGRDGVQKCAPLASLRHGCSSSRPCSAAI